MFGDYALLFRDPARCPKAAVCVKLNGIGLGVRIRVRKTDAETRLFAGLQNLLGSMLDVG